MLDELRGFNCAQQLSYPYYWTLPWLRSQERALDTRVLIGDVPDNIWFKAAGHVVARTNRAARLPLEEFFLWVDLEDELLVRLPRTF